MTGLTLSALELGLYRVALTLSPPAFRREYAAEMMLDAADARAEAMASGRPNGLWRWRAQMALDLLRTLSVQWLRSGLPGIALVALSVPLVLTSGLAAVARRVRFDIPATLPDAEVIALVLLSALVVCIIALTIVFASWTSRLLRRVRR